MFDLANSTESAATKFDPKKYHSQTQQTFQTKREKKARGVCLTCKPLAENTCSTWSLTSSHLRRSRPQPILCRGLRWSGGQACYLGMARLVTPLASQWDSRASRLRLRLDRLGLSWYLEEGVEARKVGGRPRPLLGDHVVDILLPHPQHCHTTHPNLLLLQFIHSPKLFLEQLGYALEEEEILGRMIRYLS